MIYLLMLKEKKKKRNREDTRTPFRNRFEWARRLSSQNISSWRVSAPSRRHYYIKKNIY